MKADEIKQLARPVPRYTSYPTALDWSEGFSDLPWFRALKTCQNRNFNAYVHIPFCQRRCTYCGCNVIISRRREIAERYLDNLAKEISTRLAPLENKPAIQTLHLGGGTPNQLAPDQMMRLFSILHDSFTFKADCEISIELDPMILSKDYLSLLANLGVNRVSFGIQDINARTLQAVNRPQNLEHLDKIISAARLLGFSSINYDFIYGLPHQSLESFRRNLQFISRYRPDRIALFGYAHVPWMKKHQQKLDENSLPDSEMRMQISKMAGRYLQSEGYQAIGIDHYALQSDSLALAKNEGRLSRNFMGYTTWGELDILAFGPSAISSIGNIYAQNHTSLGAYNNACASGKHWFEKGISLTSEDLMRREIINSLMVKQEVDTGYIGEKYNIDFYHHFAFEVSQLFEFEEINSVVHEDGLIKVTAHGEKLSRHIAAVFDQYRRGEQRQRFSSGV